MQKTLLTMIFGVMLIVMIAIGVFVFWKMRSESSLSKKIDVQESVDEMVEKQEEEFIKVGTEYDLGDEKMDNGREDESVSEIKKVEKKVSIVVQGGMNYVVYTDENGKELKIAEGKINTQYGVGDLVFSDAKFSPKENYIMYVSNGYEGTNDVMNVYDIKNKEKINQDVDGNHLDNVQKREFVLDEKYLFSCGSFYPGFQSATVYLMPERKKVFDVFGRNCDGAGEGCENKYGSEFYNGFISEYCSYNKDKGVIEFILKKKEYVDGKEEVVDEKTVEFELK